jgi:AcrR family transcriptional regulator
MRDIIKKAGFSQGVIYRYYSSLDDIYVDFINKHTVDTFLECRIDTLVRTDASEKAVLTECFAAMGTYIEELMRSVVGKTFFELLILYSADVEKRAVLLPKLHFKQSLEYAQQKIVEYVMFNVDKGVFQPAIPIPSLIQFVGNFIDGVAQSAVYQYEPYEGSESTADIAEQFRLLAQAVINFLEV